MYMVMTRTTAATRAHIFTTGTVKHMSHHVDISKTSESVYKLQVDES